MAEGNVNIQPGGGGGVSIHNDLTGKDAANQHPASSIQPTTANYTDLLLSADNTIQKSLDRLDKSFDFKQLALRNIEKMYEGTADIILTTTGAGDLQSAIASLTDGQILEIAANATYDPIVFPSGKSFRIRTKFGYNPKITGAHCIGINNGASNIVVSGLTIETPNNTGGNNNYTGTAITFAQQNAIVDNIVFHNITIKNTVSGSSVMLSYHWSVGGDLYYNPPQLNELSTRVAFIDCNIYKGCLDGGEGACLSVRGLRNSLFLNNTIDNDNDAGRGIQLQGCLDCLVEGNKIYNIGGSNAEGLKIDQIGTSPFRQSVYFLNNYIQNAIEGIDCDDNVSALVINNICCNCTDEGISLDGGTPEAYGILIGNTCYDCGSGILFESGSLGYLTKNNCFKNTTNFNMLNGYSPDSSNISVNTRSVHIIGAETITGDKTFTGKFETSKIKITPEGGIAIKLTNKTGANSIKGYLVVTSSGTDNAVNICSTDVVGPIGVFYESGIIDGNDAWIVVSGIADVYYSASTVRGYFARNGQTGDTGVTPGMAYAETAPVPPLATDSHFREIGHVLETRTGAGLAKTVLHFN